LSIVVITGAQGYIGTALAAPHNAQVDYVTADLRDRRAWSPLLDGADAVVHLSSRTDLRAAEADPQGDENINIAPIRALIAAATEDKAAASVIFASTVTVAGAHPKLPVDETAPDDPCSVYDRHKQICEAMLREATERGTMRACTLRLSNVYGFGGASINANRGILNIMINRAVAGEPLTIYGAGAYLRDFTRLDDVVDAFCRAIRTPGLCDGRAYVITTGEGRTLAEAYDLIAQAALQHTGRRGEIRSIAEPADLHPIEKRHFVGNSRLFAERAGWRARFDLKRGIDDYFRHAIAAKNAKTGATPGSKPGAAA
jgi:nucleoside-diphosphate-sugar epimerase